MTVHPSRHQQCLLVALFLLLLWPVAGLIAGWQWALLLPVWLVSLWLSWRSLAEPPFELIWDGQWLQWQAIGPATGSGTATGAADPGRGAHTPEPPHSSSSSGGA